MISLPEIVAAVVEPLLGLLADTGRRRALVLAGGAVFAGSLILIGVAVSMPLLLLASVMLYPASGAFVSLSQATLMDIEPAYRDVHMARWTLAGSIGVVVGPLLLIAMVGTGHGWRPLFLLFALLSVAIVALAGSQATDAGQSTDVVAGARAALAALRTWRVVRWLILLESGDLMGDVLTGYVALYAVDVAGASAGQAGAAVLVLTLSGLIGDAVLLRLLGSIPGMRQLRVSAALALPVFPAFLLLPGFASKLVALAVLGMLDASWYAIPQARLYDEIPNASGSVLVLANAAGLVGSAIPILIGLACERFGLATSMWLLMLGPATLLVLTGDASSAEQAQPRAVADTPSESQTP